MKKPIMYFIEVHVPLSHRMNTGTVSSKTGVNKYDLATKIANKHYRGSGGGGGGCGFGTGDYDMSIYMPQAKVKAFTSDLRAHGIRYSKPALDTWTD